ncbi:MAG: hypothetical protein D6690_05460 [Nitrospirae bacterium]|nr:MAG: hypothetical protein D6690_05460 [Nitrospirota bacterium]
MIVPLSLEFPGHTPMATESRQYIGTMDKNLHFFDRVSAEDRARQERRLAAGSACKASGRFLYVAGENEKWV